MAGCHTEIEKRNERVIVCIGDSITRGEVSYNYVDLLQARLGLSLIHI